MNGLLDAARRAGPQRRLDPAQHPIHPGGLLLVEAALQRALVGADRLGAQAAELLQARAQVAALGSGAPAPAGGPGGGTPAPSGGRRLSAASREPPPVRSARVRSTSSSQARAA